MSEVAAIRVAEDAFAPFALLNRTSSSRCLEPPVGMTQCPTSSDHDLRARGVSTAVVPVGPSDDDVE